jgi:hypothetical protein
MAAERAAGATDVAVRRRLALSSELTPLRRTAPSGWASCRPSSALPLSPRTRRPSTKTLRPYSGHRFSFPLAGAGLRPAELERRSSSANQPHGTGRESGLDDCFWQLGKVGEEDGLHLLVDLRLLQDVHPLLLGDDDVAMSDGDAEGGEVAQVTFLVVTASV